MQTQRLTKCWLVGMAIELIPTEEKEKSADCAIQMTTKKTTATTMENDLFLVNGCVFGVSFRNDVASLLVMVVLLLLFRRTSSFGWHWTLFDQIILFALSLHKLNAMDDFLSRHRLRAA